LQIGSGTVLGGVFTTINWGDEAHFIKLEADFNGGNTYVTLGTQELMSVPYAMYAAKTDTTSLNLTNRFAEKAPVNNPSFTGTVGGIDKSMVGLGDVNNTSDASKPVSSATQAALETKFNIADFPSGSNRGEFLYWNGSRWESLQPGEPGQFIIMDSNRNLTWGCIVTNTVDMPSSNPTLVVNTPLTDITIATTGVTGIGIVQGLPNGVSATWASDTITISGTPNDDQRIYDYFIELTGGCGRVVATGNITVTAATSAILTTTAVSSITATGASSGGTISSDGGGPITAKGVVWLTSTAPTVSLSTKTTDGTGTGTFTSTISGLVESTTYYVRAYATNAAGTSYGTELTFSTPTAPTVPGAPTNVTAVAGNAQAIVSFTAPSSAGGSVITGYTVTSSPAGGTGTATGTSSSITVTGLTNGTNYTFSVVARNAVGSSSPGVSNAVTPAQGFSCGTSTVLDGDGNPYNTVVIDGQCWTKENLKTTKYNDGITVIPFGSLGSKTNPTITGARTEITGVDISTFGYLYNWYAAAGIFSSEPLTSPKNICPLDWHVPTDNDWTNLTVYLGDSPGSQLKSKSMMWNPNSGTDNFGFSAFPTGMLDEDSNFTNNGSIAVFWSATNVTQSDKAWLRYLLSSNGIVNKYTSNYDGSYKSVGASVRCLKD
jgi:uncharacterized protein (TIGR02145 family)